MSRSVLWLILASVAMSAVAQVVLKVGMTSLEVGAAGGATARIAAVARQPAVLLGLSIYFASALVWLMVLSKIDVGFAYPFVGLGFVFTMALAWLVRGEVPTPGRLAGAAIICCGIVVLARS